MKVGDLVIFETTKQVDPEHWRHHNGIVVAEHPADSIVKASVDVLWSHGELSERIPPRILEVISESR